MDRTNRITIAIKAHGLSVSTCARHGWLFAFFGIVLSLTSPAQAVEGAVNADAKFDKTGDGMVDIEDWQRMSEQDKLAYARASLMELGLTPDAVIGGGRTRLQDYLDGLRAVYGR